MWAIIGYSLLGLLGLLILLLILPVCVRIQYREALKVHVWVFGVIPVYWYDSAKEKPDKPEKPKKEKKKAKDGSKPKKEKNGFLADLSKQLKNEGVAALVRTIKSVTKLAFGALKRVFKAITVDRLHLEIVVASEDAAATAINTGRVCAVLYPALSALQCALRIRHREVTVTPDYLAENGRITADVRMRVVPIRAVWAALWTVFKLGTVLDNQSDKIKEEQKHGK